MNLILLILGCIMDMAPIILITTPILLPVATSIGISPVQFESWSCLTAASVVDATGWHIIIHRSAVGKVPIERLAKATYRSTL